MVFTYEPKLVTKKKKITTTQEGRGWEMLQQAQKGKNVELSFLLYEHQTGLFPYEIEESSNWFQVKDL